MIVYQGDLYLGGIFYYSSGNVGQGLMKWDGEQWSMVGQQGGGLQLYDHSDAYSPTINGFLIKDGLLLVGGAFSAADHLAANDIASWNGSHWCSLGGTLDGEATRLTFYHDSLYVGFGPGPNADGVLANGVARFIGSSYQENCADMGIAEAASVNDDLHVLPIAPGSIALTGLTDGPHEVRIYDPEGRLVVQKQIRSNGGRTDDLYLADQSSALYVIVVDATQVAKWVPIR